ncbi:YraN family protein [Gemmata sp. JC717]|uniref:YraN family protein n=1 Tax=Gemmata algarum TaxID=2975278 RepID=UPI0021BB97AE|nr:YraN family protein [Gemmata algarum]MDY3556633.1 YraN family protein [Gemmata algarum]
MPGTAPAPADDEKPPPGGFSRWRWWKRWFGRRSERAAAKYLRGLRYRLLAANVNDRDGELDLLAIDGETLVIVEVRSTSSARPDAIEQTAASVDLRKQRKITEATSRFLGRRRLLGQIAVRYDVLVIAWPEHAREPAVRHIRHAFESTGRFQFFT